MAFPRSDIDSFLVKRKAQDVVESHGKPKHFLNSQERDLRNKERQGVQLAGWERAYVQGLVLDRIKAMDAEIQRTKDSFSDVGRVVANRNNLEVTLQELEKERAFVRDNLAEKLFGDTETKTD